MTDGIERASGVDLMELATDPGGASMNVGAVIVLAAEVELARVREAVAARIVAIPRLRQILTRTPWGCGRAIWVDDPAFDVDRHLRQMRCPPPGDERALLDVGAAAVSTILSPEHPRWSLTYVTGLAEGRAALLFVFHHVLADGIGGLAVLAQLVDGAEPPADIAFPRPPPRRLRLCADAWRARARALARLTAAGPLLRAALAELRLPRRRAAPSSLNKPIGDRRRFSVVHASVDEVHERAHAAAATVNDVVLTAIAGALGDVLGKRGERIDEIVASVPVSGRVAASAAELGNQVGVLPVALPTRGDPRARLKEIAASTRAKRTGQRGASALLLAPIFRALAKLRLLAPFIKRQRLVNTFVTNVRGPEVRLSFLGAPVTSVIPFGSLSGNVTAAFAVLSYAGDLAVTVVVDPDAWPDLPELVADVRQELAVLLHA